MLRKIAISINISGIIFFMYIFTKEGVYSLEDGLILLGILSAFVINILAIIGYKKAKGESWLSLFLKRKTLEEKKRIEEIQQKRN